MRSFIIKCAALLCVLPNLLGATTLTFHDEKEFPAIPGGIVSVKASFQDIHVTVRPGEFVRAAVDLEVTASSGRIRRLLKEYAPVFETREKEIRIRSLRKRQGIHLDWGPTRMAGKIAVEMPPGMNLRVETSLGNISLEGDLGTGKVSMYLSSGDARITSGMQEFTVDSSSGNVAAQFVHPTDSAHISVSSGDVRVRGPVGHLQAATSSGDISAASLVGDAFLDSSSGEIIAAWDALQPGMTVKATASSGSVRLTFPPSAIIGGYADTGSGEIATDFSGVRSKRKDHFDFTGGKGAVHLSADTSSGDISVLRAK